MVLIEKDNIECRLMWSEKLLFQNITEKILFTAVCMMINKQDKKNPWIITYERWKEVFREINKKGFARYNIYPLRFSTKIRTYQNNNRWKPIISFFRSCFCPFVYFIEKLVLIKVFLLDLAFKTWFVTWFVMDSWNERDLPKGQIYIAASSFTTNTNFMMKMKSGIAVFGEIFEYFLSSIFLEHFSKKSAKNSARAKRVLTKISQICH